MEQDEVEVAIVGGAAAGLTAALTLARACRTVAVLADGAPRNGAASAVRGFLSRDGDTPAALLAAAREQLGAYPQVSVHDARVTTIAGDRATGFTVHTSHGSLEAGRVVLATGMVDQLPAVPGVAARWGHDIFGCPYCHGWEVRGGRWGVVAYDVPRIAARLDWLRNWTDDLVVFVGADIDVPLATGVPVERRPITGVVARGAAVSAVTVSDGTEVPVDALLWPVPQRLPALVTDLRLATDEHGQVAVDADHQTSRPGIYAAGDLSTYHSQQLTTAAATGMAAAKAVVHDLTSARAAALAAV